VSETFTGDHSAYSMIPKQPTKSGMEEADIPATEGS